MKKITLLLLLVLTPCNGFALSWDTIKKEAFHITSPLTDIRSLLPLIPIGLNFAYQCLNAYESKNAWENRSFKTLINKHKHADAISVGATGLGTLGLSLLPVLGKVNIYFEQRALPAYMKEIKRLRKIKRPSFWQMYNLASYEVQSERAKNNIKANQEMIKETPATIIKSAVRGSLFALASYAATKLALPLLTRYYQDYHLKNGSIYLEVNHSNIDNKCKEIIKHINNLLKKEKNKNKIKNLNKILLSFLLRSIYYYTTEESFISYIEMIGFKKLQDPQFRNLSNKILQSKIITTLQERGYYKASCYFLNRDVLQNQINKVEPLKIFVSQDNIETLITAINKAGFKLKNISPGTENGDNVLINLQNEKKEKVTIQANISTFISSEYKKIATTITKKIKECDNILQKCKEDKKAYERTGYIELINPQTQMRTNSLKILNVISKKIIPAEKRKKQLESILKKKLKKEINENFKDNFIKKLNNINDELSDKYNAPYVEDATSIINIIQRNLDPYITLEKFISNKSFKKAVDYIVEWSRDESLRNEKTTIFHHLFLCDPNELKRNQNQKAAKKLISFMIKKCFEEEKDINGKTPIDILENLHPELHRYAQNQLKKDNSEIRYSKQYTTIHRFISQRNLGLRDSINYIVKNAPREALKNSESSIFHDFASHPKFKKEKEKKQTLLEQVLEKLKLWKKEPPKIDLYKKDKNKLVDFMIEKHFENKKNKYDLTPMDILKQNNLELYSYACKKLKARK